MEHRLEHEGRTLTVRAAREGWVSTAVTAYAGDEELGSGVQDGLKPVRIPAGDGWTIEADSLIPGRLRRLELQPDQGDAVPFPPAAGTLAARMHAHPRVWAARHVLLAVGQVLGTILGISLLVRGLIPSIDVDLPDVDLPLPDLLGWLPDVSLPDLPELHTKYWLPVVIAVVIAVRELRKRRDRDQN